MFRLDLTSAHLPNSHSEYLNYMYKFVPHIDMNQSTHLFIQMRDMNTIMSMKHQISIYHLLYLIEPLNYIKTETFLCVLAHRMVIPLREMRDLLFCAGLDGPTPRFEEGGQIQVDHLGEGLSIQIHLACVVIWHSIHSMVGSKNFLKSIPAKFFLKLEKKKYIER